MDLMLSQNVLATVDNKMELLTKILSSENFYADFDLSSLYLFIHILVHEKFIFYNFFEKVFVETYLEWQNTGSKIAAEFLKRISFVIAKLCKLISYHPRPNSFR